TEHIFVLVMHHIISDGCSLGILLRELETVYRAIVSGIQPSLPALPVQYADFAAWRRRSIDGASIENELTYWRKKLDGGRPAMALATDKSLADISNAKAGHVSLQIPAPLTQSILQFGRHDGTTPFMVLMTALAVTLRKWTDQRDMVV